MRLAYDNRGSVVSIYSDWGRDLNGNQKIMYYAIPRLARTGKAKAKNPRTMCMGYVRNDYYNIIMCCAILYRRCQN